MRAMACPGAILLVLMAGLLAVPDAAVPDAFGSATLPTRALADPIEIALSGLLAPQIGETSTVVVVLTSPYPGLSAAEVSVAGVGILLDSPVPFFVPMAEGRGERSIGITILAADAILEIRASAVHPLYGRVGGFLRIRPFPDPPGLEPVDVGLGTAVPAIGPFVPARAVDRSRSSAPSPVASTPPTAFSVPGEEPLGDGSFVVTGSWNYYKEDGLSQAPQRWATVRVWDDEVLFDELLWTGTTALDGTFTSGPIPTLEPDCCFKGNQDVYVEFSAEGAAVRVVDGFGGVYRWSTGVVTVGSEDIVDFGAQIAGTSVWAQRPFEYVNNGWDYAVNEMGIAPATLGQVTVAIPGGCTYYTRNDDTIHLCPDGVNDRSPDDVLHEYGHFVQDKLYGDRYWPSPGGSHYLCEDDQDRGLSWTEGFADFFGPRANQVIADPSDTAYDRPWDGSLFSFDLEAASHCGDALLGDDSEMNVAWALWDLFDAADDGALDVGIGEPAARLGDALLGCDQADYREFYDGGVCNWVSQGNAPYSLVATAFQDRIDFDRAPVSVLATQTATTWVGGTVLIAATIDDPDSPVLSVEFWYTASATCDAGVFVWTDVVAPYDVLLDVASLPEGLYRTCARASDIMKTGAFGISAAPFGIDRTAPWSTVGSMPQYTSTADFIITAAAGDPVGGVASVELFARPAGGAWTSVGLDYSAPWEWSFDSSAFGGDGTYEFRAEAIDLAGQSEPPSSAAEAATTVDSLPPDSSVDALPPTIATARFTATASASDATSGVAEVELWARLEAGPWTLVGTDTAAPWSWDVDTDFLGGEGLYAFYSIAVDAVGHRQPVPGPPVTTKVDTAEPSSTTGPLLAYSPASFTITATANDSGTGLAEVALLYRLDGGPWTSFGPDPTAPYAWTFDTAVTGGDGLYEFMTIATDNAGLREPAPITADGSTRVDTTPPALDLAPLPPITNQDAVDITATVTEAGSGVMQVTLSYRKDGGAWVALPLVAAPWAWPLVPSLLGGDGVYEFSFVAVDRAGNALTTPVSAIRVDTTPPTATVDSLPPFTNATTLGVAAAGTDPGSGIAEVELLYRRDGGDWGALGGVSSAPYTWTIDLLLLGGDGFYEFRATATDRAGNAEAQGPAEANVTLDSEAPAVAVTWPLFDDVLTNSNVVVEWTASDGGGIDHILLVIDGGAPIRLNATGPGSVVLVDGPHTVEVTAVDAAGNAATASMRFHVNTTPFGLYALAGLVAAGLAYLFYVLHRRRKEAAQPRSYPERPQL